MSAPAAISARTVASSSFSELARTGMSLPVITAITPGMASASRVSTLLINAEAMPARLILQ